MLGHVLDALATILQWHTLLLTAVGVLAGVVAGSIPGFTIAMAIVLTLPFTFGMSPVNGLGTMLGVFVGGLSGGLISGMLIGIPGTPSAIATTFDGYPLARRGEPGLALGVGIWSSFFGGLLGGVALMLFAPPLSRLGLEFGPWDYFALIFFALTIIVSLSGESLIKGGIAGLLGLLAATAGEDPVSGVDRFTFGVDLLEQGFAFLPILIGMFAFSQLVSDIEERARAAAPLIETRTGAVRIQHRRAWRHLLRQPWNLVRSSLIGIFVGALPAAGSSISNILAYDQAKKASRQPEDFGHGSPEGIVASEGANNATAGGSLIIMTALGIPGDVITAVILGALLVHNIVPSPTFILEEPVLVYSMFLLFIAAHFAMLAVQTFGVRLFLLLSHVPKYLVAGTIFLLCAVGAFALNNDVFDVWVLFGFGMLGYAMYKLRYPLAPMILGVVLGPIAEVNLSRAVAASDDLTQFLVRPWSLLFLLLAVNSLIFPFWQTRGRRTVAEPARHPRSYWAWSLFAPVSLGVISAPLYLMPGWVRPGLGALLGVLGLAALYRAWVRWRAA